MFLFWQDSRPHLPPFFNKCMALDNLPQLTLLLLMCRFLFVQNHICQTTILTSLRIWVGLSQLQTNVFSVVALKIYGLQFLCIPAHNLLTSKMVPLKRKHIEIKLLCQKTPLRAQSQLLPTNTPASILWSACLSDNSPQNLLSWSFIILPQPNPGSASIFGSLCEVGFCLLHFNFVWCAFLTQHACPPLCLEGTGL